jgi:hypothetical protein
VTLPAAVLSVIGGVGWAKLIAAARRRYDRDIATAAVVIAGAPSVPFVVGDLSRLGD